MFEALLSNRTVGVLVEALPRILTAGLTMTIPLTLLSFFFAMIIAVAVALVQYANVPVLRQIARFYIWVIRGTPLLVQLFIIFYGLPSVGIMLDAFPAAVIAFAFNEGAYCAETMRGALESVPQGQRSQSARGFCPRSTMRVPQPDIIEHFGNADAVPQPSERCLSRQAGIVRGCL